MYKLYTFKQRVYCNLLLYLILALLTQRSAYGQQIKNGYSYVNITKQTVGGPVEPNDILEIRYSVHIAYKTINNVTTSGYRDYFYAMRYYDNLPTNTTMITGPTALRVITNEGVTIRSYTSDAGDDAGTYLANPPAGSYGIRINLGSSSVGTVGTNTVTDKAGGGTIRVTEQGNSDDPKWYSGLLFATAFRVRVTGNVGDIIQLGNARFYYATSSNAAAPSSNLGVSYFYIMISQQQPLCDNKTGTNFADEFSGTFGTGTSLGRSTGLSYAIPDFTYISNPNYGGAVNDGRLAITKNTSPTQATDNVNIKRDPNCGSASPPTTSANNCNNRMFATWDIIGDHTGTTTAAGNPAPASGQSGGYMLLVNSNYVTGEAYKQDISGLCPNTTYEISAWVRNICTYCSWDRYLNRQTSNGVLPNLTFVLDGIDRYSTGEIAYGGWTRKAFVFTTGPTQNNVTFSIRNNAQGGGGNDWVMDDITIATCSPNLIMKPYGNASVCYGNPIDFSADVKSFFNNYTTWRWERSTDGGATWTNENSGTGSPYDSSGTWIYTVNYPPFIGDSSAHGDIIRLRIATTSGNLNTAGCNFLASSNVQVMVNNCDWVLNTDVTAFRARTLPSGINLQWETVHEQEGVSYVIEKSTDQLNWKQVTAIKALSSAEHNNYNDIDPGQLSKTTYYRIKMVYLDKSKITHQVMVKPAGREISALAIKAHRNPFSSRLLYDISAPQSGEAEVTLMDMLGKPHRQVKVNVHKGISVQALENMEAIPAGTYILTVKLNGETAQQKLVKVNYK